VIPGFALEVRQGEADAVVRLIGELDMASAPVLKTELASLAARGVRTVIVDLDQLDFIDSSGLSVLIAGLKRLREGGGTLTIRSPSARAKRVFEIAGLTQLFAIS
jgi:anti-sigma B factor antagonist